MNWDECVDFLKGCCRILCAVQAFRLCYIWLAADFPAGAPGDVMVPRRKNDLAALCELFFFDSLRYYKDVAVLHFSDAERAK